MMSKKKDRLFIIKLNNDVMVVKSKWIHIFAHEILHFTGPK